jgi:hypothetical protein
MKPNGLRNAKKLAMQNATERDAPLPHYFPTSINEQPFWRAFLSNT